MMVSNSPSYDRSGARSIWLIIQCYDQSRVFELPFGGEHCVVVGSASGADLRIDGLAPVAFYLDRDGDVVRLTPAYAGSGLCVDAHRVDGPCCIHRQALVDLFGHRIVLQVSDVPPSHDRDSTVAVGMSPSASQSRPITAIDPYATTAELAARSTAPAPDLRATVVVSNPLLGVPSKVEERTVLLGRPQPIKAIEPPLGRNATAIVPPFAAPNCIEPAPIVALAAEPSGRALPNRTQALGSVDLPAIRAIAPAVARRSAPPVAREYVPAPPKIPANSAESRHQHEPPQPSAVPMIQTRISASEVPSPARQGLSGTNATSFEPIRPKPSQLSSNGQPRVVKAEATVMESRPALQPPGFAAQARDVHPARGATAAASSRPPSVPVVMATPTARPRSLMKSHPVGFILGALGGALVLVVFLVGAAQLLGLTASTQAQDTTGSRDASPIGSVAVSEEIQRHPQAAAANYPTPSVSAGVAVNANAVSASAGVAAAAAPSATAVSTAQPVAYDPASSTLVDPALPIAAGHLFAGRLLEAEQAYRDLATRHPNEPTLSTMARLLARRNGPDCRSANNAQKSCPTVKP